jgi:hypothetical protein
MAVRCESLCFSKCPCSDAIDTVIGGGDDDDDDDDDDDEEEDEEEEGDDVSVVCLFPLASPSPLSYPRSFATKAPAASLGASG